MTGPAAGAHDLDLYDVAFLTGGPARVVDTALVALVRAGKLRIHSPGELATADLTRRHPVEAAVLDAVGPSGHRSADTVRWRLVDDHRLLDVGRRLRSAGLLGRVGALALWRRGDRGGLSRTRAGRRVLRELGGQPGPWDPEAARVALGGRSAMTDDRLRTQVFERIGTALTPERTSRRSRDIDHSDPSLAAWRTGGTAATAGGYVLLEGGGSDGGVF
jgi:hypothetical protein